MAAFPDINPDCVREVYDQLTAKLSPSGGFSKLYGAAITSLNKVEVVPEDQVEGKWVRYHGRWRGSSKLSRDLQGKGIQWCVVAKDFANTYLGRGNFWVFYTADQHGDFNVPRMSISMEGKNRINEFCGRIGGRNSGQEIEVELIDVAIAKARELGVAEPWEKAADDVRRLRHIERKIEGNKKAELSIDDLRWLYSPHEMNKFGYGNRTYYDQKLNQILRGRNEQADRRHIDDPQNGASRQRWLRRRAPRNAALA